MSRAESMRNNIALTQAILHQGIREIIFRTCCTHQQADKPNILLFCSRRGGSTWLLNTLAAHPGMRYIGRPFMSAYESRWKWSMPDLNLESSYTGDQRLRQIIGFSGTQEKKFEAAARKIIYGHWAIYPTLNFKAPYFNRKTERIVFQMTSGLPLLEWFNENIDAVSLYLVRHPISNALSIMKAGWDPETFEFLHHKDYMHSRFSEQQISRAFDIDANGSLLEKHVLDWCLKNKVPIQTVTQNKLPDLLCLSYEELVLKPSDLVTKVAKYLNLSDVESLLDQVKLPSRTVSSNTTDRIDNTDYLISRWRDQVSKREERDCMNILDAMEIDLYQMGNDMPANPRFRSTV